jgi:RNA polymerase sigma-70 factor (ECF subfamily)
LAQDHSDEELARAARNGDKEAFAVLFERHRAILAALCRRALGDSHLAEDAVQEAAVRALLGLAHLRRPEKFGPWLCGIGLNVCRLWLRARKHDAWSWDALVGGQSVREPANADDDPADRAEEAEVVDHVRRAVADLPHGQRAAILLFYLSGLTVAEVAAQLGIAPGAVKTRLHKARDGLRRTLRDFWEDNMAQTAPSGAVEMRVADVRRIQYAEGTCQRIKCHVILQEVNGGRSLTIWMGDQEASAIALRLEGIEFPRPGPYRLAANLLQAAGVQLREVAIERLANDVFYASVAVEGASGVGKVDARPSDAINLALIAGSPIQVAEEVLRVAGSEGVPSATVTIERGPEIAAKIVENWQKTAPANLPTYGPSTAASSTEPSPEETVL